MAIDIAQFVGRLDRIPEAGFTVEGVAEFMRNSRVDPSSLSPFLNFAATHYTRNLIHRSERFELMAICWEVGQSSPIHNHAGQSCWMAVPIGRLDVQNYEIVAMDEKTGYCELVETDRSVMDCAHPCHVKPEAPVHAVLNAYGERAVSLHVYSRPYDHCLVYSQTAKSCTEVPLFFDTEYGHPVRGPAG